MVKYGAYNYFGMNAGVFKQLAMDNFFVAAFLGTIGVANYAYAAQLVSYPRMLNPLNILRGPYNALLLKGYLKKNDKERYLSEYYTSSNRVYLFALLPMFIGIGLLADPISKYIFNPIYLDSLNIFYVLLISYFMGDLVYSFGGITYVKKRADIDFYSNIFSIYNVVMNIYLLKYFGLIGVAYATGTTVIFIYIYYIYVVAEKVGITLRFPFISMFKVIINNIPMVIFLVLYGKHIEDVLGIIFAIIVSLLLYVGMSFTNKIFTKKERNWINSIIGKRLWVF